MSRQRTDLEQYGTQLARRCADRLACADEIDRLRAALSSGKE